jgi:hypothetical protein
MMSYLDNVSTRGSGIPVTTSLRDGAVKEKTKAAYEGNVSLFYSWMRGVNAALTSVDSIDYYLERYMEHLYTSNAINGKDKANRALWGILQREPGWKLRFPLSRQALKGWKNLVPSVSSPPATWEVCVAIAATMASNGFFDCGVACLLSFDCYLRNGECMNLLVGDIALPGDPRLGSAGSHTMPALRLGVTKTGKNQWVEVRDAGVASLLTLVCANKLSSEKVWSFSRHTFASVMKQACVALGLASIGYVPHSFRHGGATRDYMLGLSIETILFRGRWKSNESARTYIQSGRAMLLMVSLPILVHQLGAQVILSLVAKMVSYRGRQI